MNVGKSNAIWRCRWLFILGENRKRITIKFHVKFGGNEDKLQAEQGKKFTWSIIHAYKEWQWIRSCQFLCHAPNVAKAKSPQHYSRELHSSARQTPGVRQGTHRRTACTSTNGVDIQGPTRTDSRNGTVSGLVQTQPEAMSSLCSWACWRCDVKLWCFFSDRNKPTPSWSLTYNHNTHIWCTH